MKFLNFFFVIQILFFSIFSLYAQQGEPIIVIGDSLVGKRIEGENIREVYGNVILRQKNIIITCEKAIQYLSGNDAQLIGNVIVKEIPEESSEDTLFIRTPRGFYYGNSGRAVSNYGVILDDGKVILSAKNGEYFFDKDLAVFSDSVKLYDTATTMTSEKLFYYRREAKVIAVSEVKIIDKQNIISADSLVHFRNERITFAEQNVSISDLTDNIIIYGDHLEDYSKKKYTLIDQNPLLIQIDTSATGKVDTLIIDSKKMEAYRDSTELFKATDSVKIVRGLFASRNDFSIYYKNEEKIVTYKLNNRPQPILWYNDSQLTGDSVTIFIRNNRVDLIKVYDNTLIVSQDSIYTERYNQISGEKTIMYFNEGNIVQADVFGKVLSIYYVYEEEKTNGLTKSSSQNAVVLFEDNKVNIVKLYGSPASEYHPENLVKGKEKGFTLPNFHFFENRPTKQILLNNSKSHKSGIDSELNENSKKRRTGKNL